MPWYLLFLAFVSRHRSLSTMKFLILALCVYAASAASWQAKPVAQAVASAVVQPAVLAAKTVANVGSDAEAAVLRADYEVKPEGYNYVYETANGISGQSSGTLKKVDDVDVLTVQGAYAYVAPDGTPVQFTYVADENGYQPKSDLLPVGPPIPEEIRRALEYIRAHPPKEVN